MPSTARLPGTRWCSRDSAPAAAAEGIFPSIPTAFAEDGSLDLASQAAVARFGVESGAQGLLCFGLAGEVFRLTPGERREALEAIVEAVGGRIPVLAGVGAESLHTSVALAREARAAGADGVVIPPPVTTRPSRRELARYFAAIAAAGELPAMVQDAPEFLGIELGPELVVELARSSPEIVLRQARSRSRAHRRMGGCGGRRARRSSAATRASICSTRSTRAPPASRREPTSPTS